MNDSTQDAPQETGSRSEGPGHQLRAAREAQGIERFRISEHLHLRDELIEALENDDYSRLPGPVFIRGYIRNYARTLNLEEGPLLQSFDRIKPEERPITSSHPTPKLPKVTHHNQLIIRLITWGIVLFFAAMLVIWLRGQVDWSALKFPGESEKVLPSEELPLPQGDIEPGLIPNLNQGSDSAKTQTPPRENDTVAQQETPKPSPAAAAETPEEPPSTAAEKETPLASTDADGENQVASIQSATTPDTPVQGDEPAPANDAITPVATVTLEFSGPCWVDIRGQDGKKVLVGELDAGTRRVLRGTPPFTMLIGNAPAVKISINGKHFDLARHTRGRVARLTLDPQKALL